MQRFLMVLRNVNATTDQLVNTHYVTERQKPQQESDEKSLYNPYPPVSRYGQQFINSRPNNTRTMVDQLNRIASVDDY